MKTHRLGISSLMLWVGLAGCGSQSVNEPMLLFGPSMFGPDGELNVPDTSTNEIIVRVLGDAFGFTYISANVIGTEDRRMSWTAEQGTWLDTNPVVTDSPATKVLLFPDNPNVYPFKVIVTSVAHPGLIGEITIRYEPALQVNGAQCVDNGATEPYTVLVNSQEPENTQWSLADPDTGQPGGAGQIDATTGAYTAPESGEGAVLIVATSGGSSGSKRIEYGSCSCWWEANLGGQIFSGPVAGHMFTTQFTLGFNEVGGGAAAGLIVSQLGPRSGEIGSWDANINFSSGTRVWSTGGDGTTATLHVDSNRDMAVRGRVLGTAMFSDVIQGTQVLVPFTIEFRSGDGGAGTTACGS